MTKLAQKKKISVSTLSRMVKKMRWKSLRCSRKVLLGAAMIQRRLERSIRLLNSLKITRIESSFFSVGPVFNKQNDRVETFGNYVSEHRSVSQTKLAASIMMFGVVASNGEMSSSGWVQANLCRLQRSFRDKSSSMGK